MNDLEAPPQKKKSLLKILLISGGCLLLLGGGCIALVGGAVFWGFGELEDQAAQALAGNPVIEEHIGEIEECDFNVVASSNAGGDETFVFDLVGSKGSGSVTGDFVTVDATTEKVKSGVLRMEDGSEYDLFP